MVRERIKMHNLFVKKPQSHALCASQIEIKELLWREIWDDACFDRDVEEKVGHK